MNLRGPLQWLRENGKTLPIGYDTIDVDDAKKVVPENMRLQRLFKCLDAVMANPVVETIIIDGGTKCGDYIKAEVMRQNPTKTGGFEQTSWGFYYTLWVKFVGILTTSGKHVVFIFHEKIDKDELDGSTKFYLNVQGQFKDMAGSMFTDVWRAEVNAVGNPPVAEYTIRTLQSFRNHGLKNGLGLPPVFKFDWSLIEKKLKGEK